MPADEASPPPVLAPRKATPGEVIRAVAWSFFGVRKREHLRQDAASIRPHQVLIAGVALAAVFVLLLVVVVQVIVRIAGVK